MYQPGSPPSPVARCRARRQNRRAREAGRNRAEIPRIYA